MKHVWISECVALKVKMYSYMTDESTVVAIKTWYIRHFIFDFSINVIIQEEPQHIVARMEKSSCEVSLFVIQVSSHIHMGLTTPASLFQSDLIVMMLNCVFHNFKPFFIVTKFWNRVHMQPVHEVALYCTTLCTLMNS